MQQGWISIHRKIRECFIWNEEPYDKAHAWIDLLLRANHDDKMVKCRQLKEDSSIQAFINWRMIGNGIGVK